MKTETFAPRSAVRIDPSPRSTGAAPAHRRVAGRIAVALVLGALIAAVLVLAVFAGAEEPVITGSALIGFGAGWAMVVVATRRTSQPQAWARVPAAAMLVTGTALAVLAPAEPALAVITWVWPPLALGLAVWSLTRVRRAPAGRGRWLIYPVLVALAAAAVGASVENVALLQGSQPVMPGRMYDVNGRGMHLSCSGSGSPTVVLENGLGELSASWGAVTAAVARTTRVCAFDRAGQGWSEDASRPQDGRESAADLHSLLAAAHENGPVVLVGHSTGGPYALTYAAQYPDGVSGLVLLDSSSPEQFTVIPSFAGAYEMMRRTTALLPSLARLGLADLMPQPAGAALPDPAATAVNTFASSPRGLRNARDEEYVLGRVFEQAQALTSLRGEPLVVVTATENLTTEGWSAAQDRLAALSSNSSHRVADSTHTGLLDDPHAVAFSTAAIDDVVRAVRTDSPVSRP